MRNPMAFVYYTVLSLSVCLVAQYLSAGLPELFDGLFGRFGRGLLYGATGLGQLSFLLFGIFMYRMDGLRGENRYPLLYFCYLALVCGGIVTVQDAASITLFWSLILLCCLTVILKGSSGGPLWQSLMCLPAVVSSLGTAAGAVLRLIKGV